MKALKNKILAHWPKILFAAFVLLVAGYSYVTDVAPEHRLSIEKSDAIASLLKNAPAVFRLDKRIKSAACNLEGALPDHECTPGTIFENATLEKICVPGYTKTVRNVSTSTRKKVFAEYGIKYPQPFGSFEVDHLIPLALGGSNDIANLFPEAANPYPGFKEKDVVENYLHEEVCAGNIDLNAAQLQIANDWISVYNSLSEKVIKSYKAKYKSWAGIN